MQQPEKPDNFIARTSLLKILPNFQLHKSQMKDLSYYLLIVYDEIVYIILFNIHYFFLKNNTLLKIIYLYFLQYFCRYTCMPDLLPFRIDEFHKTEGSLFISTIK